MAACSKYVKRFGQALKFRGLKFPTEIIEVMGRRAKADRPLDRILNDCINILEPPSCRKSHCKHHTSFSFCNCSIERVPGKCDLHLAYMKGVREREEKLFQSRLLLVPKKFLPLTSENEKRIREMDRWSWDKFCKQQKITITK